MGMVCTALGYQTCAHRYPVPQSPHQGEGLSQLFDYFRPGWLSFPHILKTARMTSTHWPRQHFWALKLFSSPQQRIIYCKRQSDQTKDLYARTYRSMAWLRPCTLLPKYKISTLCSGTGTFWRDYSGSPLTVLAWYTNMATVPLFWYTRATATRTAK